MSTTTIRLEDDLKVRIACAAERAGKTAHAFIIEAISQTVEQAEIDAAFHLVADARWANLLSTRKAVPWDEGKIYLQARARGEKPQKPVARKFTT